jgi:PRTRC genetic system ThiF family protein
MSSLMNIDLNSQYVNITDTNGRTFSGTIQSHYGDLGVRNTGIVEGNYTIDLMEDLPEDRVEVPQIAMPPLACKHTPYLQNHHTGVDMLDIIVVGCGGTGAYVIRDLTRFIYSLQTKNYPVNIRLHLFDADIVEEKNLIRQNFIPRDLGQYKAEVMAKRYGTAFGINITAHREMLNYQSLRNLENTNMGTKLIIGCVDNNLARREIDRYMRSRGNTYWIDSGNERQSGQVICGYGIMENVHINDIYRDNINNTQFPMPSVTNLYPEILDETQDHVGDDNTSCAERALVEDQNIFVNMTAANNVLNFSRQIILKEPITIGGLEFNIKGVNTVHHLTEDYLKEVRNRL